MASLFDEIQANRKSNGSECGVIRVRKELAARKDKTLLKDFDAAMSDRAISAPAIAKALGKFDVKINHNVLGHHRRGGCSCKRP